MSHRVQGYHHWTGQSTGVWRRRLTITEYGLRLCWRSRLLKILFAITWVAALGLMAFHFLIGQLLTPDSAVLGYVGANFGQRAYSIVNGLAAWILLYPEVSVDGLYRISFFAATQLHSIVAFIAVALFVPKLISHDLSSNAILIYNSKALTRFDYLLGKFGVAFTLLAMLSLVPLVAVWLVGNVVSPDWSFFYHGFPALARGVTVAALSAITLSLIAMAISSLAKRTSSATAFWILAWIISAMIAGLSEKLFGWGRYLNPGACIDQIARHLYDLSGVLEEAKTMLPFFRSMVDSLPGRNPLNELAPAGGLWVPLLFLAGYWALCLFALGKRVQPE